MGINVKRINLRRIDPEKKVLEFDPMKHGKITGSRFLAVLGKDGFLSDFKAACMIARIFWDDTETKYTRAGEVIEPIIRAYVRENSAELLSEGFGTGGITVEEPVDKRDCYYDHFRSNKVFGGLVDGFIDIGGKRAAVLEIKTSGDRSQWTDDDGKVSKVPEGYLLQASLYAELAGLDRIVFAVGFLTESDYDHPESFVPDGNNVSVAIVEKKDIRDEMGYAEAWFRKYILNGTTPEWTEKDAELMEVISTDRLDLMPRQAQALFSRFDRMDKTDVDTTDVEDAIVDLMVSASIEGVKKVVYEQGGNVYTVSLEGVPKLTVDRK